MARKQTLNNIFNFGTTGLKGMFVYPHWRKAKTKLFHTITVDEELDISLLNLLNSNRNIQITSVCSGHDFPTDPTETYRGNFPSLTFYYYGSLNDNQVLSILHKIPNSKIDYSSIQEMIKFNAKYGINDEPARIFEIHGKAKGTLNWWKNVASIVSRLN